MMFTRDRIFDLIRICYSVFARVASYIFLIFVLNIVVGCHYYGVKTVVPRKVQVRTQQGVYQSAMLMGPNAVSEQLQYRSSRYFVVHYGDSIWHLKNFVLKAGESIEGMFEPVADPYKSYMVLVKNEKTARYSAAHKKHAITQVHLYVSEYGADNQNNVVINLSSVKRVDVYDMAKGKTFASYFFNGVAIGVPLTLTILLISFTNSGW